MWEMEITVLIFHYQSGKLSLSLTFESRRYVVLNSRQNILQQKLIWVFPLRPFIIDTL